MSITASTYILSTEQFLEELSETPNYRTRFVSSFTEISELNTFSQKIIYRIGQMEDRDCLVGYLNDSKELLAIRHFIDRGRQQDLAENIIGHSLINNSQDIVVVRNRKSGISLLKSHDRQLIRYLLTGMKILGTSLLDYIVNRNGHIYSAREAGILRNSSELKNLENAYALIK